MNSGPKTGAIRLKDWLGLLATVILLGAAMSGHAQEQRPAETSTPQAFLDTLSPHEQAWLREHPVIRVAQDPGWPPIEFTDARGAQSGMTAEYLRLVEERLGVKFERVRNLSWQEAYARLQRWEIDLTTTVAVTAEREKFWAFTKPYMTMPIVVVTRADVTYIADLRELAGKKVAVVEGYVAAVWIARDFPEVQLVRVQTTAEALALLQRGEVLACVENMLVVGYYLAEQKMTELKIAGSTPYTNAQCMAVRKDWATLAGILDKAVDSVSPTEREAIYRRWLPLHYEPGFDYTRLWQIVALLATVLLGSVAWNWKLAREIRERKQAEAKLRQSEARWQFAIEGFGDGVWDWNVPAREVVFSSRWKAMLGFAENEIGTGLEEWSKRVHPEDLPRVMADVQAHLAGTTAHYANEHRMSCKDGSWKWMLDRGLVIERDAAGQPLRVIGTHKDITERKQAEASLRRTDRALRIASECNQELVRANSETELLQAVCRIVVEHGGYRMAWVGFAEQNDAKSVRPVAQAGSEAGYLDTLGVIWADTERGRGPTGTAIRTGQPVIARDIPTDPSFGPWRAEATQRDYNSSVAFPLLSGERAFGVLSVYAAESDAFNKEEVALLGELVGDLGYGITALRTRAERVQAERAMITSEIRYRRLFESAKDGILILDAETGMIVDVNPFLVEMLGYSHEVFLGKKVWELGFFKNLVANQDNFAELQAKEYIRYEDMALETKAGRRIEVEFVSNVYLVDGHKVIQCNIRDMTERVRADEKTRQSLVELEQARQVLLSVVEDEKAAGEQLHKLSTIIEQAPLSVVITDLTGAIEYVNPRFSLVTGYTSAEALGQNPRILNSGETPAQIFQDMWATLGRGQVWSGELRNRKKNGETYLETAVIAPVVDAQGRATHYVALKDDITAQKRHEAAMRAMMEKERQVSEMKTRFISVTSHEFRTPMAAALGSVEILANHLDRLTAEKRQELLARIATSLQRMTQMLDEILLLNRVDANRVEVQLAPLDLQSFVHQAIEEIRLGDRDQHRFEFSATGDALAFPSDPNLLHHILSNLLSNAVRYSPAGTLVAVRLVVETARAQLSVEDHGIGIPESDRSRIFEPFERGSNVGTIKGTGLGLNIVQRMIGLLGGTVEVAPAVGGGSRFTLTFPRLPSPTLPP